MKKSRVIQLLGLILIGVALGFGYTHRSQTNAGESITAVGSTALQPLVEAAGEQYSANHTGIFINVQGGGSGTGLSQIQSGAVAIGNSDIFAEEQAGIQASKLKDHRVAVVGIAPIVNAKAGVTNLTQQQLIKIFTGKITNWREVGGKNVPIVLINRAQGSGTRKTFESYALNGHKSAESQEQDSSGLARSIVSSTPGAISYVAFSYLDKSVTTVTMNGVRPTEANVRNNRWKIWSYEHLYTSKNPNQLTKNFINYVLSTAVQKKLVTQLGYISVHAMQVERSATGKITTVK
ncbi:phosphate ABC transporter substrate-binding protein PstS family protein [Lactiplantibacillus mudanjiangensis]|uniref:Phosphate-binding protein n=1 Tax=Lactiplantibacillus mudanjiangensis TaxID=1296538 RepID=A0A660E1D6_9LACO|nr:phosphate ABC transporter substrate-binding protein PstS family protein [Lactiplantibacillus mudanjiangensis]VDG17947.1 phosphate ABC transporter, substrate binding protein [Lactobacillus plantarum JDM1] [Lactiplantibacillus mudanjiangensis]VDG24374.1 phosphate ABC transporter, substrate binding protein [Lactobacillus plantarum JDM1] [Lactiplantibacillus mudanjiangensis]VDG28361.1 phosphate ABC transporter, substrate binding protein [Lactobacillus plantarum JDM1] [Lactiplantibacillus mudanjia